MLHHHHRAPPSPCSRTLSTTLSSGKLCRDVLLARRGTQMRFKWYCRPGDLKFSVTFYPGVPSAGLVAGPGVTRPEPARYRRAPSDGAADAALLPSTGGVVVHKLTSYPDCDKAAVEVRHTPAADGYYVATWDNRSGWRSRELFHRWDVVVDGRPVEDPSPFLGAEALAQVSAPAEADAGVAAAAVTTPETASVPAAAPEVEAAAAEAEASEAGVVPAPTPEADAPDASPAVVAAAEPPAAEDAAAAPEVAPVESAAPPTAA
jgi:hypothetical protein